MPAPGLTSLSIDWNTPTETDGDGRAHFRVRCRVPFEFSCHLDTGIVREAPAVRAPGDGMGDGEDVGDEPSEDLGDLQNLDRDGNLIISGVSSSTSVDWYGTEMSLAALEGMAAQMKAGVPLVPTHWDSEWPDVMGASFEATVERVRAVEAAANPSEQQFLLKVSSRAYADHECTEALVKQIRQGVRIGQSIGGWFTEVRFIAGPDGEIQRVIIEEVTLDHNALTRTPANPDCWLDALRAAAEPAIRSRRGAVAPSVAAPPADAVAVRSKAAPAPEARSAAPFADLPIAEDRETEWMWDAAEQDAVLGDPPDWTRYRTAHAWYDPEMAETKGGYKLPIARVVDGSLRVVWRGLTAAMAALNGARGGVDIPDDEREPVYRVLSRYYAKFDAEPPELASLAAPEPEAARAAPPADPPSEVPASDDPEPDTRAAHPPEDTEMTPEQIAEIVNAAVRGAVAPLQEEINGLRAANAPKTETPEDKIAKLESALAERDTQIARLAQRPEARARGGLMVPEGPQAGDEMRAIFEKEGRPAMAALMGDEKFRARLEVPQTFEEQRRARESAKSDLRTLLRAAEADGTLRQWWRDASSAQS